MVTTKEKDKASLPFTFRKLTKAGATRYLSVGTIIPKEWDMVKVITTTLTDDVCVLRLERIR